MTGFRVGYSDVKAGGAASVQTLWAGEAPLMPGASWDSMSQEDWDRLAITSSWVYSDVQLIARTFSKARFQVMRWEGEDLVEVPAHPYELLLRRPNPYMGASFLWQYTVASLLLRGEAYWWKVPDRTGQLVQLWPIPPSRMEPIPDAKTYIAGYSYTPRAGGEPQTIPPEYVCFFRLFNLFDYHRGMSPLTAYQLALKTDRAAASWNYNGFDKGAPLRMIVSVPENMSAPNFERFRADIEGEFAAGKQYLIARGGTIDAKVVGATQEDLDFLAGREFTREEIDRVYGVPPGFWAKEATRANSEAAEAALIEYTVMPLHVMVAEEQTAQVLPAYGEGLEGQFEDIRKEDRALLVQERTQYWNVKTVDEARADLGLDELEDKELGKTLVPLAIKGQPAAPAFGGGLALLPGQDEPPGGEQPDKAEEEKPAEDEQVEPGEVVDEGELEEVEELGEAAKADLRRWQSIARRRVKAGESPAGYEFESAHIPPALKAAIARALAGATTEEGVRAAFAAAPFRLGWEGYP